jgi:precorrin-2 dehydrogenase/sirohydrochlorin ferrochelatase
VAPELTPRLKELARAGEIVHLREPFRPEQVAGMALVLAATDDPKVNAEVSAAAQAAAIWVNVADAPEFCTFIVPAKVRRGDLTVAISTDGASPALAQKLRRELTQRFGPEYAPYLALLKALRARLLAERRGSPDNERLFHRLVDSQLLAAVAAGDRPRSAQVLAEILGTVLSPQVIEELLAQVFQEAEG